MGYEIDFLGVGKEGHSGDAILLRFGDLRTQAATAPVVLIDGGFTDTADDLITHLDTYYNGRRIDLVISTHPDADHINGLRRLMQLAEEDEIEIGELWMHRPSKRRMSILLALQKAVDSDYAKAVNRTLEAGEELEQAAEGLGIPIYEPFTGLAFREDFMVVGPTEEFYSSLFENEAQAAAGESRLMKWLTAAREMIHAVAEAWDIEALGDDGVTSPINNSSVITLLREGDEYVLFTADAGIPALELAVGILHASGFTEDRLRLVQVPHHGSRRNVGPTVLDRLLGPRRDVDSPTRNAIVSCCAKGAPKHPAKKVTNAFRRRNRKVSATRGGTICFHSDCEGRPGWTTVSPLPFYDEVEE